MMPLPFDPFPVIHTPRLLLRRVAATDVPELLEMRSDPLVMQYIPRPLARTEADIHDLLAMIDDAHLKKERINWAIEWRERGKLIGMIGYVHLKPEHYRAEVGYSLSRAWHRQGIMREALKAITDWGFKAMQLHTVEAIIDAENVASGALLEDAGFAREAYFREDFLYDGVFRNSVHYGLLRPAL